MPWLASLNVSVPMPTLDAVIPPGLPCGGKGTASKAGPVASKSVPENVFAPALFAVITSHQPLPARSYVNHEAKMTSPWCAKLIPHPDSDSAGALYHRPLKLRAPETDAVSPAKLVATLGTMVPLRVTALVPSVGIDVNVTWSTPA